MFNRFQVDEKLFRYRNIFVGLTTPATSEHYYKKNISIGIVQYRGPTLVLRTQNPNLLPTSYYFLNTITISFSLE